MFIWELGGGPRKNLKKKIYREVYGRIGNSHPSPQTEKETGPEADVGKQGCGGDWRDLYELWFVGGCLVEDVAFVTAATLTCEIKILGLSECDVSASRIWCRCYTAGDRSRKSRRDAGDVHFEEGLCFCAVTSSCHSQECFVQKKLPSSTLR